MTAAGPEVLERVTALEVTQRMFADQMTASVRRMEDALERSVTAMTAALESHAAADAQTTAAERARVSEEISALRKMLTWLTRTVWMAVGGGMALWGVVSIAGDILDVNVK